MTRYTRIIATGRNHWQQTPPMSEARRQHHHGPLLPMDDKQPGDGELAWLGALICLASAGLTIFAIVRVLS